MTPTCMQKSDSSIARSLQAGGFIIVLQKVLTVIDFLLCISHLYSSKEKISCFAFSCVSPLSLFWGITDSSILCITWINLQNSRRSLGKVQDAVDHWGCRHVSGHLNCFLRRRIVPDEELLLMYLTFTSVKMEENKNMLLLVLWEQSFVVVIVVCLY